MKRWTFIWLLTLTLPALGLDYRDLSRVPVQAIESEVFSKSQLKRIGDTLGVAVGRSIDLSQLNRGLRQLHKAGKLMGVFIRATSTKRGLVLQINGTWVRKIRKITYKDVDDQILETAKRGLELEEGESSDMRAFAELRERIREAYRTQGYYFADVDIVVKELEGSQEADVEVLVSQNQPTRVTRVTVSGADAENEALRSLIPLRAGNLFNKERLEEGVQRINQYLRANQYPTSKVEQTDYDFSPDELGVHVKVLVKLEEKYQFLFKGNEVFQSVELRGLVTEEVLSQIDATKRIQAAVEKKYQDVGYHFVSVRVETVLDKKRRTNLVKFDIQEGPKVIIDKLHFSRGEKVSPEQFEEWFYESAAGVIARRVYWEAGMAPTVAAFRSRIIEEGYLSSTVSQPKVVFTQDREGADIFFEIDLGPRTFVTGTEFKGVFFVPVSKLEGLLDVEPGEPINRKKIQEGRERILNFYRENGYVDARFENADKLFDLTSNRRECTVPIHIVEGTQYYVGEIQVSGNQKTQEEVLLREMKLEKGDKFDPNLVRQSEEDIALLGLFSRVEVVAATNPIQANRKDLTILVRENRPGYGEVGFGALFEDPRLRLRSFFGLAYRNLLGLNQTASVRTQVSLPFSEDSFIPFVEYGAVFGYRAPYPLGIPLIFSTQVGLDGFEVSTVGPRIQRRARVELKVEKQFSKVFTGIYRMYRYERTTTEELDTGQETTNTIGSTGPGFILDFRDDIFNPQSGSYHTFDLELAHPALLSADDTAFVMAISRNSVYLPLVSPFRLGVFVGLGYAKSLFGGKPLPTARLGPDLSLGGQGSIRGFAPRRFSPDFDTANIFQTAFYNARVELGWTLFSNIGTAIFFDTGQIFPNLESNLSAQGVNYGHRHDGVGFGFRYKTPVGPVVIDIAKGLGPDSDTESVKFYFTVGTI